MPHRLASPAAAAVVALLTASALTTGCAFDHGQPWGRARFAVAAGFDPAARLDDDGSVRTSRSYALALERLELSVGSVGLTLRAADLDVDFDPASPPPGFSLCHNGHCHADDGSLPTYEEVERVMAERAGQTTGGGVAQVIDAAVALEPAPRPLTLGACSDGCELPRGALGDVTLSLRDLTLRARVFDRLGAAAPRLPAEGVAVVATVPLDLVMRSALSGALDKDTPGALDVDVRLLLTPQLFDGVDWAALLPADAAEPVDLSADPALREALVERLRADPGLTVSLDRHDL